MRRAASCTDFIWIAIFQVVHVTRVLILRDILPSAAVALTATATLGEALDVLRRGRLQAAPVIANGNVLGIVSARDMQAWLTRQGIGDGEMDFDRHTVEEVMSRRVIVLPLQAGLDTALCAMRELGVEHVVVMEAHAYMGLVSMPDLLRSSTAGEPVPANE